MLIYRLFREVLLHSSGRLIDEAACKQNILCEIMLVKKALYPYQQSLREPHQDNLSAIKRFGLR